MRTELEEMLFAKYPNILRKDKLHWGLQCGDGWYNILDKLCAVLQHDFDVRRVSKDQPVAKQVKEKFGGLRFDVDVLGRSDFSHGAITMAEGMSFRTCEECGAPGILRKGAWLTTLCDEHDRDRAARWNHIDMKPTISSQLSMRDESEQEEQ